jgi:sugar (pentulose or hexulose) kinase
LGAVKLHRNEASYEAIVAMATAVPRSADRLLFLPYLNGERLGGRPTHVASSSA